MTPEDIDVGDPRPNNHSNNHDSTDDARTDVPENVTFTLDMRGQCSNKHPDVHDDAPLYDNASTRKKENEVQLESEARYAQCTSKNCNDVITESGNDVHQPGNQYTQLMLDTTEEPHLYIQHVQGLSAGYDTD